MSNQTLQRPPRKTPEEYRTQVAAKLKAGLSPFTKSSDKPEPADEAPGRTTLAAQATRGLLTPPADTNAFVLHVDLIDPDPDQPRDDFESAETKEHIAQLAASITEHGQLEAVVVRPLENGRYMLSAGECRWRAIKFINNGTEIRATIRALNDKDAQRDLIQLDSNEQRRGFTKLQLARAYQRLQDRYKWSDAELARQVNKSRQYVSKVKALLDAPQEVQDALTQGRLSWREFVNNKHEVMRDHAAGVFHSDSRTTKNAKPKSSTQQDEQSEPNVGIPQSIANQIFLHMQDVIEDKGLSIEIPKNPTRRQLGEFISKHFRKIRKASA
jgi:ParB/RepB/Spo0J family partition protein